MAKLTDNIITGQVIKALPNTMFRVMFSADVDAPGLEETDNGKEMIAYLGGKMKIHRIKVLVGDTVDVLTDSYGGKGRIVKRK